MRSRLARARLALPLALALLGLAAGGCAGRESPPNVVIFLIDTLRADRLGAYGHAPSSSPVFDALAAEGVLFEQAYAPAPWTLPSTVSLLTSLSPCEHRVLVDGDRIAAGVAPLAERLQATGRATASFFANPYAGALSGLDRGFDLSQLRGQGTGGADVEAWLRSLAGRPFFLYLHNVEPHDPYQAGTQVPRATRTRVNRLLGRLRGLSRADWDAGNPLGTARNEGAQQATMAQLEALAPEIAALYAADVAEADARLGQVVTALRAAGAFDDTLLVVVSDHGEEFGEHGGWQHDQSLYDELLRVPLLIRLPGGEAGGQRVREPVSLLDVLPTLADVLGEPELAAGSRGRSLLPAIEGRPASAEPRLLGVRWNRKKFYEPFRRLRGDLNVAVRAGRWKAIWNAEPDTLELYDLARDPGERSDRSASEPELAGELAAAARAHAAACLEAPAAERGAPQLDDATREQLEHLGYLDE